MDDFLFADEDDSSIEPVAKWKILVADDEPEIHSVTKLILQNFQFQNKGVEIIRANSAAEAKYLLKEHDDLAIAFLDVVMETETAGLDLVGFIRDELQNSIIRIVLRTGQPGQAPEEDVIRTYDINDYKCKSELTALKFKTMMYTALRSYQELKLIQSSKFSLEQMIHGLPHLYKADGIEGLAKSVLEQLVRLLDLHEDAFWAHGPSSDGLTAPTFPIEIKAGTGTYADLATLTPQNLPCELQTFWTQFFKEQIHVDNGHFVAIFNSGTSGWHVMYMSLRHELNSFEIYLLEIYSRNVVAAFENFQLKEEIRDAQLEIVSLLGEAVEKRSKETGGHVKRVASYTHILAKALGLSPEVCDILRLASPLHDVGKVGIPDSVLNKPAKLDPEEWAIMQQHAQIGFEILENSKNRILQYGARIAQDHHERWDGKGYSNGKAGEDISIEGRITALADVFDALGTKRCYKQPWTDADILDYLKNEKGKQFDPKLVDLFFEEWDTLKKVREEYPDD